MMPRFLCILPLLLILSACAGDPKVGTIGYPERITDAAVSRQSPIDDARPSGSADSTLSRLRAALSDYRRIEATGGWPILPAGPKLELGAQGERVQILRQRLAASGDLAADAFNSETFDQSLAIAVRRFQARHGLTTDGVVGPKTLAALNVPVSERIVSIRLNQDRVASEGRDWGQRYIVVNVAAASYRVVEDGRAVLEGPAIVGKPSWPTPRFASIVRRLEFNPYWNVPPRIARLEVWPKIRRDAGYLKRNNMRVIDGQIRQEPGPGNPLGVVKFIFDNPYEVYLHDTNDRSLFERSNRFLSHGCVRVSHAIELAKQLLKMDPNWPEQRIDEAVESGRNIRIDLLRPIPIHIVYDTMWIDDAGIVQFRDDVYGLDRRSLEVRTTGSTAVSSSCGGADH
jgi:L,D-transpeptidase YcbB